MVSASRVRLELTGWDKLWSFKTDLAFSLAGIYGVYPDPNIFYVREFGQGVHMPGTYLPGVIRAGTFYGQGRKDFWCVKNPQHTLVFELVSLDYNRLIVDVPDPEAVVQRVRAARWGLGVEA